MGRVVGILGGMGPQATVDLMSKVIALTPAKDEPGHIRMLVDCNPQVPHRATAIYGDGPSPGPVLAEMAQNLVKGGAELLAIPCNTAHYFLKEVEEAVDVPVLDMIKEAAVEIRRKFPEAKRVGLLATRGTLRTRLYHDRLEDLGLTVVEPAENEQQRVDWLTKQVKLHPTGQRHYETVNLLLNALTKEGADLVVAGCTEIPLALPKNPPCPTLDPTNVLASSIVKYCIGDSHA